GGNGNDRDGGGRLVLFETAKKAQAVDTGELQVEQNEVRPAYVELFGGRLGRLGFGYLEFDLENVAQEFAGERVILNEYSEWHCQRQVEGTTRRSIPRERGELLDAR